MCIHVVHLHCNYEVERHQDPHPANIPYQSSQTIYLTFITSDNIMYMYTESYIDYRGGTEWTCMYLCGGSRRLAPLMFKYRLTRFCWGFFSPSTASKYVWAMMLPVVICAVFLCLAFVICCCYAW